MLEILKPRLKAMGLPADAEKLSRIEKYHEMLESANQRMNLTRVLTDISEAVDRNYLDSLALYPLLRDAKNCVDIGSGAGLPGIPLSIFLPDARFVLMDSLNKRVDFLTHVIQALGLNAQAIAMRAEDAGRSSDMRAAFGFAVSRAVAPMNVLSELMLPLLSVGGKMLCLKGPSAEDELETSQAAIQILGGQVQEIQRVNIPGRDWAHAIVVVEKTAPTPEKYPRRAGVPERKPL